MLVWCWSSNQVRIILVFNFAYVTPVHTYFSYAYVYAYVYAYAYAYVKVWTSPKCWQDWWPKGFITFGKLHCKHLVSNACKNILKMPLREERVVLHTNQVYSVNKVWKAARARACGLKTSNRFRQQCSRLQIMFHFALTKVGKF